MYERFTETARQVVVQAQEEARHYGHAYIGTEHILLALLTDLDTLGCQVLNNLGLDLKMARTYLQDATTESDGEVSVGRVPYTTGAQNVLELSLREALSLGHNYISTEHLLLALARGADRVTCLILGEAGLTAEKIRNEVIRELSRKSATNATDATNATVRSHTITDSLLGMLKMIGAEPVALPGTLTVERLEEVADLALKNAGVLGMPQTWRQAWANLADAAQNLVALSEVKEDAA